METLNMNKHCARRLQEQYLRERIDVLKLNLDYVAPELLSIQAIDAWTDRVESMIGEVFAAVLEQDDQPQPQYKTSQRADCEAGGEQSKSLVEC